MEDGDFERLSDYQWVAEHFLNDAEGEKFISDKALEVVDIFVHESDERGFPNWFRAINIANNFLRDKKAEVLRIFEPALVDSIQEPLEVYEKMDALKYLKKVYPEIFESASVVAEAKKLIIRQITSGEADSVGSLGVLFSLTEADLAADTEISGAARAYLVEKLITDPNANDTEDPDFKKCVEIAGAGKSEVYAGIYKDALVESFGILDERVQSGVEDWRLDTDRVARNCVELKALMSDATTRAAEEKQPDDTQLTDSDSGEKRMDPEVKEAFKKAFASAARVNDQKVCMALDTDFITSSEELLRDEDLGKVKEELLANALTDMSKSARGYERWLSYFIYAVDGETIRRAVLKAMEIVEEKVPDGDKFNFLLRILDELPEEIHRMLSELSDVEKYINESEDIGRSIWGYAAFYKDQIEEGRRVNHEDFVFEEDPTVKEGVKKICTGILREGNFGQMVDAYNILAGAGIKSASDTEFEPDEAVVHAARIGALLKAEEVDSALSTLNYFDWLANIVFKKHPEIAAEVMEKKYLNSNEHANLQGLKGLYARLEKVRPTAPVSREMAESSIARYRRVFTDLDDDWSIATWLENTIFTAQPDVLTPEKKTSIAKEGAISQLERGHFSEAKNIFEDYLQNDVETKKECLTSGLRGLLRTGDLHMFRVIDTQTWIKEEAPEILEEIAREKDTLVDMAKKVGVMAIGTDVLQYQPREWSTMMRVFESGEIILDDEKKEAAGISRIRKEIMAEYEEKKEFVISNPYKALVSYLGDGAESVIWEYLGQRDKHQMLEPVEKFVRCMTAVENAGGSSRKGLVQDLFVRAGMGSGMQADVWRNIMGKVTPDVWKLLETISAYPDAEPPLANKDGINLLRIQNEIKLHQTPELRKAVGEIPKDKPELRAYAAELMRYPTINIEAIVRFIKDPKAFWASRSGAGEDNRVVAALLRESDPSGYPNWSTELSRDAIVEGSYDKLNSFEPIAVEWSEMRDTKQRLDVWANSDEEAATGEPGMTGRDFKNLHKDVQEKLKKADPFLAEKSDKSVDMSVWASYAASDEVLDASMQWCMEKGEVYAKKAVEYDLKQKLAEPRNQLAVQERYKSGLEARFRKATLTDDERAQIEANIASAADRIHGLREAIVEITQSSELQMAAFVSHVEKLKSGEADFSGEEKRKAVKEFWARVEQTDFKVSILHLAKQLAGKEFANMDEFREFAIVYADRRELADRLSTLLDEAEKSPGIDWFQAEVLKPSSVESAIAGTLSGTCDAFGHGKKAHFMANPICSQFVLRQSKGKPKEWNTDHVIAQSLMTDNRQLFDKPQDRWDFFTELANNGGNIAKALTKIGFTGSVEDFLKKYVNAEELIVLDSVEVPINIQKKMAPSVVYKTLQDAFGALVQKNSRYDKSVRLGTQWSYVKGADFPHAPNTDVWVAPLAYSDNLGLNQHKDSSIVLRDRIKDADAEKDESKKELSKGPINVRPARPQDALAIAMMEDIAFRRTGGESYITGLLAMTRNLNTACLQSAHHEHAPIAFVEENVDDKGEKGVTGYLIAQTRQGGDMYIDDTATTGEVKGTGTRLLMKLLTEARGDEQLKKRTIRMDCRGTTSALAISKPSSVDVLRMMGYRLDGPKYEEVEARQSDRLFSYALVPMAA